MQVRILRLVDFLFVLEILVVKVEAFSFNLRFLSMFHADVSKTYSHIGLKGLFLEPFLSLQELKEKERLKADNGERDMEAPE